MTENNEKEEFGMPHIKKLEEILRNFKTTLDAKKEALLKRDSDIMQGLSGVVVCLSQVVGEGIDYFTKHGRKQGPSLYKIQVEGYDSYQRGLEGIKSEFSQYKNSVERKIDQLAQAVRAKDTKSPEYEALQKEISGLSGVIKGLGKVINAQSSYDESMSAIEELRSKVDNYRERVDWMHNKLVEDIPVQIGENRGRIDTLGDAVNSHAAEERQQPVVQAPPQPVQPVYQQPVVQTPVQQPVQPYDDSGLKKAIQDLSNDFGTFANNTDGRLNNIEQRIGQRGDNKPPADGQPLADKKPPIDYQPHGKGQKRPAQQRQQPQQQKEQPQGQERKIILPEGTTLDALADKYNKVKDVPLPHIKANHSYHLDKISVATHEEFRQEVIKYMKHHEQELYGSRISDETAFGRAYEILEAAFKGKGGFTQGAYLQARNGRLKDIIDILAKSEEKEGEDNHKLYVLTTVDPLDWDTKLQLAKEFKNIYGQLIPQIQQQSPEQLAPNYQGLIVHHAAKKEEIREILEKYQPVQNKAA